MYPFFVEMEEYNLSLNMNEFYEGMHNFFKVLYFNFYAYKWLTPPPPQYYLIVLNYILN